MSTGKKLMPSNLGAEPKKLAILGGLVVLLGVVYFMNSGPDIPPQAQKARSTTRQTSLPKAGDAVAPPIVAARPQRPAAARTGRGNDDFRPTLKVPEDFDLSKVDPTLQLDKLEKVRAVGQAGGRRSLFEFFTPPPPPPPVAKINPAAAPKPVEAPKPAAPVKTGPPPPPPIPVKFYGYAGKPGDPVRRAFFLDGDEIFVKAENEMIRDRYKIVRINVNSAEVEDTVSKNRQTLQIVEPFEKY